MYIHIDSICTDFFFFLTASDSFFLQGFVQSHFELKQPFSPLCLPPISRASCMAFSSADRCMDGAKRFCVKN